MWMQPRSSVRGVARLARSKHRGADGRPVPGGDVDSDRVIQELNLRRREAEEARRVAEAALARLAESEERFRMLAERTSDVIIRYDPSGMIEYASPAARAWGYAPHELIGRNMAEFCHPQDQTRLLQNRDTITRGEMLSGAQPPFRLRAADGDWRWAEGNPSPLKDKAGRTIGAVTALRDVTARRALEDELARRRAEAEAANQAKSTFLATMSHEIRTPLNGVLGMVEAMAVDALTPSQRERLEVIRASGAQLLSLLNDILDISKIEAGKLTLETVEFGVAQLCSSVVASFAGLAEAKGVALELEVAEGAGVATWAIRPVCARLWAIRLQRPEVHGPRAGGRAGRAGASGRPHRRQRHRRRHGAAPGETAVPEVRAGRLIDHPTLRRDRSRPRHLSRAGRADGRRRLGREPGREGRRVHGRAPARGELAPAEKPAPRAAAATDASLRLLVAEDNEVNRLVIRTLLGQAGLSPTLVCDGAAAIAAWEAETFDLILMDVQMPLMDGPGATQAIRRREAQTGRARTPIIALTANALAHQVEEYEAAGMDGHVAKPIEIARLFEAISTALAAEPQATAHEVEVAPSAVRRG